MLTIYRCTGVLRLHGSSRDLPRLSANNTIEWDQVLLATEDWEDQLANKYFLLTHNDIS